MPQTKRILLLLIFALIFAARCFAWTDEQIADAVFKAEGGYRAAYLYGIRSVKYKDEADARRICLNTIRNNRIRFAKQSEYTDFITFLGHRYAPIENCKNDPKGLNNYWLKNVRFFLEKSKK